MSAPAAAVKARVPVGFAANVSDGSTFSPPRSREVKVKKVHRPISALKKYLADYAADRNMVFLTHHKAIVDRIYHQDERITSWRAYWHAPTGTPYLRRGSEVFAPDASPELMEKLKRS